MQLVATIKSSVRRSIKIVLKSAFDKYLLDDIKHIILIIEKRTNPFKDLFLS